MDVEADFMNEMYIALNDREFLNLHSWGALGEGVNRFPPDMTRAEFSVGSYTIRETASFPPTFGFGNGNGSVVLVLPASENPPLGSVPTHPEGIIAVETRQ
jgi:hypothetical protein